MIDMMMMGLEKAIGCFKKRAIVEMYDVLENSGGI